MTRPGGDDAAGRAGHSWPLPVRSPTPLAWVMAPAKLPDTETPRGLRVSGTILRLMGSDSSAPPPSAPFPLAAPPLLRLARPLQTQSGCDDPADTSGPETHLHKSLPSPPICPRARRGEEEELEWDRVNQRGTRRGTGQQSVLAGGKQAQQNGSFPRPCCCFQCSQKGDRK